MQPQVNVAQPERIATTPSARKTPPCLAKTLPPNEIRMPTPIPIFVFLLCSGRIFNPLCLSPNDPDQARRARGARFGRETRPRRCLKPACSPQALLRLLWCCLCSTAFSFLAAHCRNTLAFLRSHLGSSLSEGILLRASSLS